MSDHSSSPPPPDLPLFTIGTGSPAMTAVAPNHFLALPRPNTLLGHALPVGVPDTSTLAAHDFDVDTRTGFLPPQVPLTRLPVRWERWEEILDDAGRRRLQLGDKVGISAAEQESSATWRASISSLPVLPIDDLEKSEYLLRRAHHVLSFILHLFIHSLPPSAPILIPAPLTIPLLQVSAELHLPPTNNYTDNVLYNWKHKVAPHSSEALPTLDNLACQTLFSNTPDEEAFYLASTRIELRGVEALELMRSSMDELFHSDTLAERRVTSYLQTMATVIRELRTLLLSVREGCNPDIFYNQIRPWFKGADSDPSGRPWVFEGLEDHPELAEPIELSGPSAGQSPLVHALDVFLGVDRYSHTSTSTGARASTTASAHAAEGNSRAAFLERMQIYMSRHHRTFLRHLSQNQRPLRDFVERSKNTGLLEAYNECVKALKEFRDSHMIVVALYIIGPAKKAREQTEARARAAQETQGAAADAHALKGTGGTNLVKFLKGVRDRTAGALFTDVHGRAF
ncbi:hypothetical protein HWV62_18012 [Athelia sp. TMB]|nr:hypothetical protein HWV62_18012 [Athelia sp. TMB]